MIQMPQRSVTRFFIPLIDVLILLFCIYMLLPLASSDQERARMARATLERELEKRERQQARQKDSSAPVSRELQEEIRKLRQEKARMLQDRLVVRVLKIGRGGKLYYQKRGADGKTDLIPIDTENKAQQLIDEDRRKIALQDRELFYIILYPSDPMIDPPTVGQMKRIRQWFSGVALETYNPLLGIEGGDNP